MCCSSQRLSSDTQLIEQLPMSWYFLPILNVLRSRWDMLDLEGISFCTRTDDYGVLISLSQPRSWSHDYYVFPQGNLQQDLHPMNQQDVRSSNSNPTLQCGEAEGWPEVVQRIKIDHNHLPGLWRTPPACSCGRICQWSYKATHCHLIPHLQNVQVANHSVIQLPNSGIYLTCRDIQSTIWISSTDTLSFLFTTLRLVFSPKTTKYMCVYSLFSLPFPCLFLLPLSFWSCAASSRLENFLRLASPIYISTPINDKISNAVH